MKTGILIFIIILSFAGFSQSILRYKQNESLTYQDIKQFFLDLKNIPGTLEVSTQGHDDGGEPMLLLELNKKNENQIKILIMNAIHPGESEGTEACIEITEKFIQGKLRLPENVSLHIIPVYNIGGYKNRKTFTREGQNGPKEKGFRGNALNYDLNRDFIKADTRNTFAFYRIFHSINPQIFIDTHTSNGADYQHTLTLIESQSDKYRLSLGEFIKNEFTPGILKNLSKKGIDVIPYVNVWGKSPENGYTQFLETARYSTGYAALFGTIAYVTETHMLKPYPDRVEVTLQFILETVSEASKKAEKIKSEKDKFYNELMTARKVGINFINDTSKQSIIHFKGYAYLPEKSNLGNYSINQYNRTKPFEKKVRFYNYYRASDTVDLPKAYVIPAAWKEVIHRLELSGVKYEKVYQSERVWQVTASYVKQYKTSASPFEGHYLHYATKTEKVKQNIRFYDTVYVIPTAQKAKFLLAETLEAESVDSYFNWNFFDIVLQQKEGYNDYHFEDEAERLLKTDATMAKKFENWKIQNPEKLNNKQEVLSYLFSISPYQEAEYMRLPIFRLEE